MKTYDLSELALRNLRESSLRNSLTTIGISVGVASLVAMLSLGIGLQKLATRRLASSGLFDTVVVMSRRDLRGFGRGDERNTASAAESRALDEPARQEIERLPDGSFCKNHSPRNCWRKPPNPARKMRCLSPNWPSRFWGGN